MTSIRLLVIHTQGPLWTELRFIVNIKYARQRWQNGNAANFFRRLGLQAEHADAAMVLYMQFWTPDISFNIDLWPMNPGTNNLHFLVNDWNFSLNGWNQPCKARRGLILQKKSSENLSFWPKNSNIQPEKFILKYKLEVFL